MFNTRILLIADNIDDAELGRRLLNGCGCLVTHAQNLQAAQEYLSCSDLILLYLSASDCSDLDRYRALREIVSKVPIVIVASVDKEDIALEAIRLGAQDFLCKDGLTASSLRRAIAVALQRTAVAADRTKKLSKANFVASYTSGVNRFEIAVNGTERRRTGGLGGKRLLLESDKEFVATVAHDLKSPLMGTNRLLEYLVSSRKCTRNQTNCILEKVIESNQELIALVGTLVDVYRKEMPGHLYAIEPLDLRSVVSDSLKRIEAVAELHQITLSSEFAALVPLIRGNRRALSRVVQNLLDNALKFTSAGGTVTVRVFARDVGAVLEIEDTGLGIAESEQMRLFRRFEQLGEGPRRENGDGLGLYLSKQILEGHAASINCISAPGAGTTFTIVFPVADSERTSAC